MNDWFAAAAVMSTGIALLHTFAGGHAVARPSLATSELGFVAKYTNYYCWHVVTLTLGALAVMFAYAAAYPAGVELGVAATMRSVAFAALSIGLIAWRGKGLFALPQWILFVPLALVGGLGMRLAW